MKTKKITFIIKMSGSDIYAVKGYCVADNFPESSISAYSKMCVSEGISADYVEGFDTFDKAQAAARVWCN